MNKFLGRIRKTVLACTLASFMMGSAVLAMPEIIGLSELKQGMWGKGYTVIDESGEIRDFDVELVGVLGDNGKMTHKRILVNLYGDVVDRTGGAVAGMSGSPIYFDGKLAGALSASYKGMYPDRRILLTPIEDMLKIWDYADGKNKTQFPQVDLKKMKEAREKFEAQQAEKAKKEGEAAENGAETAAEAENAQGQESNVSDEASENAEEAVSSEDTQSGSGEEESEAADTGDYVSVVDLVRKDENSAAEYAEGGEQAAEDSEPKARYFASGFGAAGLKLLRDGMGKYGIEIDQSNTWDNGASMLAARPDAELVAGSPVGVALAIGDFTFGSMGTVTAVDGKRILAFGHSFTQRGNVNYFMTDARVISTINGPTDGMKLGDVSGIIGRVNQDRQDGVGGILGQLPQTVSVIVRVHDKDTEKSTTYNTMLAYDEDVLGILMPATVYSSINGTLDRMSDNTALIKFALRSNYGKGGVIERSNMFYDEADVALASLADLNNVLGVILGNKEREPNILNLKVDVTVAPRRMTATLISAVPTKKEVLPGETVDFETTIKPYRSEKVKLVVPYTIPETQPPGNFALDVHGGGFVNIAKLLLAQQEAAEQGKNTDEEPPVAAQLQEILSATANNEIVIESTVVVPKNDKELKESIRQAKKVSERLAKENKDKSASKPEQKDDELKNRVTTDYIIENIIHTNVKVLEKK